MNYAEFEATIHRICTMSEEIAFSQKSFGTDGVIHQKEARDEVVRDLLNWAKARAQL